MFNKDNWIAAQYYGAIVLEVLILAFVAALVTDFIGPEDWPILEGFRNWLHKPLLETSIGEILLPVLILFSIYRK